jgi:hypothetical protein
MIKKKVLVIEDEENAYETIREAVAEGSQTLGMSVEQYFGKDLQELEKINDDSSEDYVLIVLDLKLSNQPDSAQLTLHKLKDISRRYFIPCVIYTAYDAEISDEQRNEWHFFRVVTKSSLKGSALGEAIIDLLQYKYYLISLQDEINKQFRSLSTEVMDEIFGRESQVGEAATRALMISRLLGFMTRKMDYIAGAQKIPAEAKIIYPPLQKDDNLPISMGDVLRDTKGDLWLVMSPTCDMVNTRAETQKGSGLLIKNVLIMRCFTSHSDSNSYSGGLKLTFDPTNERSVPIKVPSKVSPDGIIMVHTKMYETRQYDEIKNWDKVLSVSSPYAEDIKATVIRDLMRVGAPDTVPATTDLIKEFNRLGKKA